jgi:AcrR family transcriptional regulator
MNISRRHEKGLTAMTPAMADRTAGDAGGHGDAKITRDVVLAAALQIIDRDGAEALSMRRLARAWTGTR